MQLYAVAHVLFGVIIITFCVYLCFFHRVVWCFRLNMTALEIDLGRQQIDQQPRVEQAWYFGNKFVL